MILVFLTLPYMLDSYRFFWVQPICLAFSMHYGLALWLNLICCPSDQMGRHNFFCVVLRFDLLKQEWVDLLFGFTTRVFLGLAEDFRANLPTPCMWASIHIYAIENSVQNYFPTLTYKHKLLDNIILRMS